MPKPEKRKMKINSYMLNSKESLNSKRREFCSEEVNKTKEKSMILRESMQFKWKNFKGNQMKKQKKLIISCKK